MKNKELKTGGTAGPLEPKHCVIYVSLSAVFMVNPAAIFLVTFRMAFPLFEVVSCVSLSGFVRIKSIQGYGTTQRGVSKQ